MIEWASLGRFLESYSMKSPNHSFMTMLVVMTSISHNTNVLLAWVLNFLFYVFFFTLLIFSILLFIKNHTQNHSSYAKIFSKM